MKKRQLVWPWLAGVLLTSDDAIVGRAPFGEHIQPKMNRRSGASVRRM